MIKEIFLPKKLGERRILSQRIVGVNVKNNVVYLTVTKVTPKVAIIEKVEKCEIQDVTNIDDIAVAVKKAFSSVGSYDQVVVTLPSSKVIFKELEFPFDDEDKIRMVLDYEIESMLPFSIQDAIVDFIITKRFVDKNKSRILVAISKKDDIQELLEIYEKAKILPHVVTLDLFALYSITQITSKKNHESDSKALVDIEDFTTKVSFIIEGELRLARNIHRGLSTIIDFVHQDTNVEKDVIKERIAAIGFGEKTENNELDKSIKEHFINFFNDIQFTLNSFGLKLNYYKGVRKIFLHGKAYDVRGIDSFVNKLLQIPCEIFNVNDMFSTNLIKNGIKKKDDTVELNNFVISIGATIPLGKCEEFNLRRKQFSIKKNVLLIRQIVTAGGLLFGIFGYVVFSGYNQTATLQNKLVNLEKSEIKKLLPALKEQKKFSQPNNLLQGIKQAEKVIKEKNEIWFLFSKQKIDLLSILLELTNIMNKDAFDFFVNDLAIKQTNQGELAISINGTFKSHRGTGHHLVDFLELENRFKQSKLLTLAEQVTPSPAGEEGVKFLVKLKKVSNNGVVG
jgi:Tfp pilus assembly PilM family ATPase